MTNEEIIQLNCKTKEGRKSLKTALRAIKLFEDLDDVKLNDIESAIVKLSTKSNVNLSYVMPTVMDDVMHYSFMLKNKLDHKWITTVYAISAYEGFAKSLLIMVNDVRAQRKR